MLGRTLLGFQTDKTAELSSAVTTTTYFAKLAFIFSVQWEFPGYLPTTAESKSETYPYFKDAENG